MPQIEWFATLLVLGLGFILLGVNLVVRGRKDEGYYFSSLSKRPDVRKYLEKRSLPTFISLRVGGRVCIAIGVALLVLSVVLWARR
ncbi:MAG: hypothetical protein V1894_03740 [Chloroflexota bacterium]